LKSKHKKQRQRNRPRNKRNRLEDSHSTTQETSAIDATSAMPGNAVDPLATEKTRDQIMAEREAKKLAKQAKKQKTAPTPTAATPAVLTTPSAPATKIITEVEQTTITTKLTTTTTTKVQDAVASKTTQPAAVNGKDAEAGEKTREQIKAEREAKKAAKKAGKGGGAKVEGIAQQLADLKVAEKAPVAASAAPSTTEADQEKVTCYIYDFLASYTSHLTLHRKSQLLAKRSVALSKKPNGQPRPRYRLKRPSMQPRHHPAQLPKGRTGRAFPPPQRPPAVPPSNVQPARPM